MTESMLSADLTCLLMIAELAPGLPVWVALAVFALFFVCPVTAEPPTEREVLLRDLFSCTKRLFISVIFGVLLRNAGPYLESD